MANQLTGNPLILDTAAATVLTNTAFRVSSIKWTVDNGGADNDTCVLTDKNGVVKYEEILNIVTSGPVQAPQMVFPVPVLFDGLVCLTLSGGKCYVYLAEANHITAA
jgi:hypothetical protein